MNRERHLIKKRFSPECRAEVNLVQLLDDERFPSGLKYFSRRARIFSFISRECWLMMRISPRLMVVLLDSALEIISPILQCVVEEISRESRLTPKSTLRLI